MKAERALFPESDFYCTHPLHKGTNRTRSAAAFILDDASPQAIPGDGGCA